MTNMRIVLVTDGVWPFVIGGMQKHSYFLMRYLAKHRVNVILVHPKITSTISDSILAQCGGDEREYIEVLPVDVPIERKYPGHYLVQSYKYSKACFEALEKRWTGVDFVIAQGLTGWYFVDHKEELPPIAIHAHGYEFLQRVPDFRAWLQAKMLYWPFRNINKKADYVFSLGGKLNDLIVRLGVNPSNILEVPGGIESEWAVKEVAPHTGKRRFVFVGRYERRKGIEELVAVLKSIKERNDFEFHFVGSIPTEAQLDDPKVIYHGPVHSKEDMQMVLQQSDILVCPSFAEGMPTVILEAMANGCAVLATDVGAVSELVTKATGWLISPANVRELREAMIHLIEMPDDSLLQVRRQAKNHVLANFLWDDISVRTIDLLKQRTR